MNTYEVKSDIRQTVTIWIAIISLILGNTLFRFSNFLASLLAKHFSVFADFFAQWEYLGMETAAYLSGWLAVEFSNLKQSKK